MSSQSKVAYIVTAANTRYIYDTRGALIVDPEYHDTPEGKEKKVLQVQGDDSENAPALDGPSSPTGTEDIEEK